MAGPVGVVAALVLLGLTFGARGVADERRERRPEDRRAPEVQRWRHGDIRHFRDEDLGRWRAGRWFHGEHFGRQGWWWVIDGAWYSYPVPVYPYPDPYTPPAVVVQAPPPAPAPNPPPYWYYCASVKAYYPYVTQCPEGWMEVVPQAKPPGQ